VLKPALALILWFAFAVLMIVNNMVGDTVIATSIGPRLAAWYKAMVPIPYVALLAMIHARRTAGPQWLGAAAVPAVAWPLSTAVLDAAYGRITFEEDWASIADRYGVQWGAPFPWLLLSQVVLPPLLGWILARTGARGS
jgi:hypothetical protein